MCPYSSLIGSGENPATADKVRAHPPPLRCGVGSCMCVAPRGIPPVFTTDSQGREVRFPTRPWVGGLGCTAPDAGVAAPRSSTRVLPNGFPAVGWGKGIRFPTGRWVGVGSAPAEDTHPRPQGGPRRAGGRGHIPPPRTWGRGPLQKPLPVLGLTNAQSCAQGRRIMGSSDGGCFMCGCNGAVSVRHGCSPTVSAGRRL